MYHFVALRQPFWEESFLFIYPLLDLLETDPFLSSTLPWGSLSILHQSDRDRSDDGPILWVRPGEQLIPTAEIGTPNKRKKRV